MKTLSLNNVISLYTGNPYPVLEIHESILSHNLELLKKITGSKVKILIPVKANAYGCGIAELIPFFKKSAPDYLGVANPYEAYLLRSFGWGGKILNLGGFFPDMADIFFEYNITPSITDIWQIEHLDRLASEKGQDIEVHIKLDLGMGRIGIQLQELDAMIGALNHARGIRITGIFTHYPSGDEPEKDSNKQINSLFRETSSKLIESLRLNRQDIILHAANSYSLMLNPESHFDMVRPGISFYGYFSNQSDRLKLVREFPFLPSLRLKAKPISIRNLQKGTTISYGESCKINRETSVGVIPLGYADGIPRNLSNKISFGDHPLLGRVTMDQIILGEINDLNDTVELLGPDSPALEEWADLCTTISYEIMTGLGDRIERKLV